MVDLLICVPVYGQHDYTHALVGDLRRESVDFLIVDNRGDYPRLTDERVIAPGENLGWAGGSNLGYRTAFSEGYTHAMTLNNDTRISCGFAAAMTDGRLPERAGVIGPVYNLSFDPLLAGYDGAPEGFTPAARYRNVKFMEGTALTLTRECWLAIGDLDERSFRPSGWGADIDLAMRARNAGFGVVATEMAYVQHFGRATANEVFGRTYGLQGGWNVTRGMRRVWGRGWARSMKGDAEIVEM